MLPYEENELVCRTGPGTLMGALFRRYWLPIMMSSELEADGTPVTTRVLSEDLMAFRDTDGRVGLMEQQCPHRLAPLYIGRNEEAGIRCLYHGWKFDVTGQCVDMPNEPAESNFRSKVRVRSFPVREHAGVVWGYLGDPSKVPEFPVYKWTQVPESHRIMARWIQDANWLQSLEGGIDTSHASFLHRRFDPATRETEQQTAGSSGVRGDLMWRDKAPRLELQPTNYGFRYAAIRQADEDKLYVRITPHIMPCSSYPPGSKGQQRIWDCWVPRDDESCWAWDVSYHETRPITPTEVEGLREVRGYNSYDPATFRKHGNRDNLWQQDRKAMQTVSWSGIRGIFVQDNAVQEGMGAIVDRTREHLGTADLAIIAARRLYLQAARDLVEHGIEPPGVMTAGTYQDIDSFAYIQPDDKSWHEVQPLEQQFVVESA
jgi:phenylpropionate dioxygenase-like ring-hydroxylating dioxygenase large terminal subunit